MEEDNEIVNRLEDLYEMLEVKLDNIIEKLEKKDKPKS